MLTASWEICKLDGFSRGRHLIDHNPTRRIFVVPSYPCTDNFYSIHLPLTLSRLQLIIASFDIYMAEKEKRILPRAFKRSHRVSGKDAKYLRSEDGYWAPTLVYTYTKSSSIEEYEDDGSDAMSIISHSTNATVDNLPGAGRVMGNFYQSLGRKLERAAMQFGIVHPPPAQILRHFTHEYAARWISLTYWEPPTDYRRVIRDMTNRDITGLKSLIKQTQSVI